MIPEWKRGRLVSLQHRHFLDSGENQSKKNCILHCMRYASTSSQPSDAREGENMSSVIAGKKIVFTGKMGTGDRDDLAAQATSLGAAMNSTSNFFGYGSKICLTDSTASACSSSQASSKSSPSSSNFSCSSSYDSSWARLAAPQQRTIWFVDCDLYRCTS